MRCIQRYRMTRQIQIVERLSVEELGARYRQSTDVVERGHYQMIWLLARGHSTAEVASVTGYSRDWLYKLVRRYNTVPEGIHLLFLPLKSPELQPAERLWPIANEAISNRSFESLEQLEDRLAHRCRALISQPDFVRGLTNFYW